MRKSLLILSLLLGTALALSALLGACRKEQKTSGLNLLTQEVPAGFPAPLYAFKDNPLSEEGFELGRRLFYDTALSADLEISCGSCHEQRAAFGTFQHDRSHGVFESHTLRNAPALMNLAWSPSLHWDGEFTRLTDEAAQPLNGHIEMGMNYASLIAVIRKNSYYREAFRKVFGDGFIRPENILKALSQFTGSLVTANSRYDQFRKGTTTFTTQENNGYQLFKTHCAGCHPEPLFTDYQYYNIGLPVDDMLNDYGRMRITGKKEDSLKFKVPSLRNVYISSNYMHDGRMGTLMQCINHYRFGVQQSPTLDPRLQNGITLTNAQADDIVSFLRTLTDSSFIQNPRFANPY